MFLLYLVKNLIITALMRPRLHALVLAGSLAMISYAMQIRIASRRLPTSNLIPEAHLFNMHRWTDGDNCTNLSYTSHRVGRTIHVTGRWADHVMGSRRSWGYHFRNISRCRNHCQRRTWKIFVLAERYLSPITR